MTIYFGLYFSIITNPSLFLFFIIKLNKYLCYACNFSQRNGFGPVPSIPGPFKNKNNNIYIARELQILLLSLTAMEEEAIRQVTPLISILRLSHGNIGSEVNTRFVWKKLKLNIIVPDIPSECNFIIIHRHKRN